MSPTRFVLSPNAAPVMQSATLDAYALTSLHSTMRTRRMSRGQRSVTQRGYARTRSAPKTRTALMLGSAALDGVMNRVLETMNVTALDAAMWPWDTA